MEQEQKLKILLLKNDEKDQNNQKQKLLDTLESLNFHILSSNTYKQAIEYFQQYENQIVFVISALGIQKNDSDNFYPLVEYIRKSNSQIFIRIFSKTACQIPQYRLDLFNKHQCNMVTCCLESIKQVGQQIKQIHNSVGSLECPICKQKNFTEDTLWIHIPLYHCNENTQNLQCPICKKIPKNKILAVHYRNCHGPCGRGEIQNEHQPSIYLSQFSLVVVRKKSDNTYLLVQEFSNSGFWLPGGRVDNEEILKNAAIRECKEEAGIDIDIKGILTIQMHNYDQHSRQRIIYYAEPIDENQLPKSVPCYESVGACYVSYENIKNIKLRGNEPLEWIGYLENNGSIYPLEIFSKE